MTIKLYIMNLSPPVRAAMMACDIFNVSVEMIEVNLLEKKHLNPEFVMKNPLHTVPVLEDDDFILHDSHAILMYLADTYSTDESWYPKDIRVRALVNQKLFFDTSILFPRLRNVAASMVMGGSKNIPPKQLESIEEAYSFMEQFLTQTTFIAGAQITIADLSAITYMSSLAQILPLDEEKYPKTVAWLKVMEKKPYCQKSNNSGATSLGEAIKHIQES